MITGHDTIRTIKRIPPDRLPVIRNIDAEEPRPATEAELLNLGISPLGHDDLYAVIEQVNQHYDPDTGRTWTEPRTPPVDGDVIAEGFRAQRFEQLPADVKANVLRADVLRATDPDIALSDLAAANLQGQRDAYAEYVGDTGVARLSIPAVVIGESEISTPDVVTEAKRLAAVTIPVEEDPENPDVPLIEWIAEAARPTMASIEPGDVVLAENIIPHAWAGEPPR